MLPVWFSVLTPPFEGCAQGEQSAARGGPLTVLNGATATDVVCVAVPEGMELERPIHLLYLSASATLPLRIAILKRLQPV